jgi:hypothetical protein
MRLAFHIPARRKGWRVTGRRDSLTVPLVIWDAASDTASLPPLAWLLAWLVGLRESLSLLSLPAQ